MNLRLGSFSLLALAWMFAACGDSSSGSLDALDTSIFDLAHIDGFEDVGAADEAQVEQEPQPDVAEPDVAEPDEVEPDEVEPDEVEPDEVEVVEVSLLECFVTTIDGNLGDATLALTLADEPAKYKASAGFQVDILAQALHVENGQMATLTIAGVVIATSPFTTSVVTGVAEVRFKNVTLEHSLTGYAVEVAMTNAGGATGSCTKTVTVDTGLCSIVFAPLPTGSACVLIDGDPAAPGFQMVFTVSNPSHDCAEAVVEFTLDGGAVLFTPPVALDENGAATVTIDVSTDDSPLNGVLVQATGRVQSPGHPEKTGVTNAYAFHVDTVAPVVTITAPLAGVLDLSSDLDAADGLQVNVQGSVTGLNPSMTGDQIRLSSLQLGTLLQTDPDEAFLFGKVSFAADGTEVLRVEAVDACGQTGFVEVTVELYTVRPVVQILEPTEGAVLFAKNDGNPATPEVFEADFSVLTTGLPLGRTLTASCRPAGSVLPYTAVGSLLVADLPSDSIVTLPVALDVTALSSAVQCLVTHDYPNASQSDVRALTVALPAPLLQLTKPLKGRITAKATLTVEGKASHLDGQALDLLVTSSADGVVAVDQPAFATVVNDGLSYLLDLTVLADGEYVLAVDGADGFGNVLSEQFAQDLTRTFGVDRTAPTLTLAAPADLTFDDAVSPDTSTGLTGYQNTLQFQVSNEHAVVGTTVCVSANNRNDVCKTVTDPSGLVSFPDLTFIAGANSVEAYATDVAGNSSSVAEWTLTRLSSKARVEFIQPPYDLGVKTDALTVLVKVSNATTGEPFDGGTVLLLRAGVEVGSVSESVGGVGGLYAIPITLVPGANVLQAKAVVNAQAAYSWYLTVNYKTAFPGATFVTPTDAATLNLASADCSPGFADCRLTVTASTTDVENGSAAVLTVTCGASTITYDATVASDAVLFEEVVLADQSTCFLTLLLVDEVGQEAQAGPITVSVDRVRPRLVSHNMPAYVLAKNDLDPVTPGVQLTITLTYSGLEAGRIVELVLTDKDGNPTTSTIVAKETADSATASGSFVRLTLPSGVVGYAFSTADAAGNAAVALSGSIMVVADAPAAWLYLPAFVPDEACATDATCQGGSCVEGRCYQVWNKASVRSVGVGSQGIPMGLGIVNNVRLCSSSAPTGAEACASSGFGVVSYATITTPFASVPLTALADGGHKVIVEALADPLEAVWVSSLDEAVVANQHYRMFYQDLVAPSVEGLIVDADSLPPAGVLNLAEKPADGRFAMSVTGSEAGTAFLYVGGIQRAKAALVDGEALFLEPLAEGAAALSARLCDAAGNDGALSAVVHLTIDTEPPGLAFENPTKAVLNALDSADAVLKSDEQGVAVELFDGAVLLAASPTAANFRATFDDVLLADGTYALSATGTDVALNSTSLLTPVPSVLVDRTPPTLEVLSPADLALLDDADAGLAGFQVASQVQTSGAVTRRVFLAKGCDAAFAACGPAGLTFEGPVTNPGGPEPLVLRTLPGADTPYYQFTYEAEDDHGNVTRVVRNVQMNVTGCLVQFTNLPDTGYLNNGFCLPAGEDCSSVTLDMVVTFAGACPAVTDLELWENGAVVATQGAVGGTATFVGRAFDDGQTVAFEARAKAGVVEVASSGVQSVVVDLSDPVVTFVSDDVLGFSTPASGSSQVYGLDDDQDGGTPDLQIHVYVLANDENLSGGSFDRLESAPADGDTSALAPRTPTLPLPIESDAYDEILFDVSLAHGVQTVSAFVLDAARNEGQARFEADVDMVAPDAVVLADLDPDETVRRLPRVVLDWVAPGDDADQGQAVAYDVRFSRDPITDADSFEAACPAAAITALDTFLAPKAAGEVESFELRGPDVRPAPDAANPERCKFVTGGGSVTYHFAVRAQDDAGNVSPVSDAEAISTDALNVRTAKVTFTGSLLDAKMDRLLVAVGDVTGDGRADFVNYSNTLLKACIYAGRDDGGPEQLIPDLDFSTDVSAAHRCYSAPVGAGAIGQWTAGLGDVDGDGVGDFALGIGTAPERVDVYLGITAPAAAGEPLFPSSPFLQITGQQFGNKLGSQVYQVGDFNGDGIDDIGIASRVTNVFYIVLGDTAFTQGVTPLWQPGDAPIVLNVTDPGTYGTLRVVRIRMTGWTDPKTWFGMTAVGLGNMLPDPGDDDTPPGEVAIYAQNGPNQVIIVKGRAVAASADLTISASGTDGAADDGQTIRVVKSTIATQSNFGSELAAGGDLNGEGRPDLVIGHLQQAKQAGARYGVNILYGEELQASLGTKIVGVGLPAAPPTVGDGVLVGSKGVIVVGPYRRPGVLGDFDGSAEAWGSADLLMVDESDLTWGWVGIRHNEADAAQGIPFGSFPFEDLRVTSPYPLELAAAFGYTALPLGDFNGDGLPDILVGVSGGGFPTIIY